jgi:hypothetical protein
MMAVQIVIAPPFTNCRVVISLLPYGVLSPLQAQIDLALSPNRLTLPDALLKIDFNVVRQLEIDISSSQQVSRFMNMAGGGIEILIYGRVPIEALRRVR